MEKIEEQLQQIRQTWWEGEYASAYTFYEKLLKSDPESPIVPCDYGLALYAESQDMEKATELLTQSLTLLSCLVKALLGLGELYSIGYGPHKGREGKNEIIALFQKVVDCHICNKRAKIIALMQITFLQETPQEKIQTYRQTIALDPMRVAPHHNLAMEFCNLKDFENAAIEFKRTQFLLQAEKSPMNVQENLTRIEKKEPGKLMYMIESVLEAWFNGETETWESL